MFYRIVRTVLYPFVRMLYRVRIIGKENIPVRQGYILCANHTSIADMFALSVAFRGHIRFMAKAELFRFPPLGWVLKGLGTFAVNRGSGDTGAIDKACAIVQDGGILGIFPEGTRSKDGTVGRAKSGAALVAMRTKAPLLPVSIRYSTGTARLFCRVTVHIGQLIPYVPPAEDETQRREIRRVSETMMGEIKRLWEDEQ